MAPAGQDGKQPACPFFLYFPFFQVKMSISKQKFFMYNTEILT
jgi:hypothetical protein